MGKNKKKTQNAGGAGKAKTAPTPPIASEPETKEKVHVGEDLVTGEAIVVEKPSESVDKVLVTVENASIVNAELVEEVEAIPDTLPAATPSKGQTGTVDEEPLRSASHDTKKEGLFAEPPAPEISDSQAEPAQEEQKTEVQPVSADPYDKSIATPIPASEDATHDAEDDNRSVAENAVALGKTSPRTNTISLAEEVEAESPVEEEADMQEAAADQPEEAKESEEPVHTEEVVVTDDINVDAPDDLFVNSGLAEGVDASSAFFDQASSSPVDAAHIDVGGHEEALLQPETEARAGEDSSIAPVDLFAEIGPTADDGTESTAFFDQISSTVENPPQSSSEDQQAPYQETVVSGQPQQDSADGLFSASRPAEDAGDPSAFFDQQPPTHEEGSAALKAPAVTDQPQEAEATDEEVEVADDATDLFGDVAEDARVHEFEIAVEQTHEPMRENDTSAPHNPIENASESVDLFGQSADQEDDLFGNEWTADGAKDDLFGTSQQLPGDDVSHAVTQNGDKEDDLFGSGGVTQEAEDLFGAATTTDLDFINVPTETEQPQPSRPRVEDMDLDAAGVPQGWVDEQGGWNWYSAEERLDVARGMFGETQEETQEQTEGE